MNFAPYQDESPEVERALSPPLGDANRFKSPILGSPRGLPRSPVRNLAVSHPRLISQAQIESMAADRQIKGMDAMSKVGDGI